MKRFLCLNLPRWPLQCLYQARPATRGQAVALFERTAHGPRLSVCSPEAARQGVARQMSMADATALAPELQFFEADPAGDRAALERLALWAGQFSPLVGIESASTVFLPLKKGESQRGSLSGNQSEPQAFFLDIAGCEHLFRGEANLLRRLLQGLTRKNFSARAAIAPTLGAAWALAHFESREDAKNAKNGQDGAGTSAAAPIVNHQSSIVTALASLPLASLRIEAEALLWLQKLGLRGVADLVNQPRASLPARFGPQVIQRLDQALGVAPEVFVPLRPPPEIQTGRAFEYLLKNTEFLLAVIDELLGAVVAELQQRGRGAREIECWFYHELSDPLLVKVTLFKSSASRRHLLQLLQTRLDDVRVFKPQRQEEAGPQPEDGICAVALRVTSTEPLDAEQLALFSKKLRAPDSLAMTLDRISTRLGPGTVLRPEIVPDPQPEDACRLKPFVEEVENAAAPNGARPLQLFPEPLPIRIDWPQSAACPVSFEKSGGPVTIRAASGPERIETGWWKDAGYVRRDYYVVESDTGARYWIFHQLDTDRWYLHGCFR